MASGYHLLTGLENLLYWAELQDVDIASRREGTECLLAKLGLNQAST